MIVLTPRLPSKRQSCPDLGEYMLNSFNAKSLRVRIGRIEVRHLRMPLRFRFETSFGAVSEKSFLLVRVFATDGSWGIGECVAEDHPYYLPETNGTALHILRDFLAPLVLPNDIEAPEATRPLFAGIRGHQMAKAAVEMAIWDLFARTRGESLAQTLGGDVAKRVEAGVSIGLQPSVPALMERVRTELAAKTLTTSKAWFICALSLGFPDGHCETFEGRVDGELVFPPRGTRGFGYDPIFRPDGHAATFGEMDPDAKHAMSHRARAFAQLIAACFDA